MNKDKETNQLLSFIIIVLTIGAVIEVSILTYAYFNADKVECNWLWCTFTDVRESNYKSFISTYSECFVNGVQVNCSDYKQEYPENEGGRKWEEIMGKLYP